VHEGGHRLSSATKWELFQPMPMVVLSELDSQLKEMGLSGSAVLMLREAGK
jgi:hypothetical protein